jgi:hypothetical protein
MIVPLRPASPVPSFLYSPITGLGHAGPIENQVPRSSSFSLRQYDRARSKKKKNIHTEIEKKNNFVSAAENSSNRNSEPPKCPIAFTLAGPVLFSFLIIIIISSSLSKASSVCLCVSILLYGAQQDRTT